jgi:predicted cobalt transporter CbtA
MAGTSAAFPATDRAAAWPGLGWLRVAVLAGLVGGLGAAAVNGILGEPVLGEAIGLEEAGAEHVAAVAAPFSRGEQQGGMVLGELVLGAGLGLLLAGAALLAGPAFLGPTRRAWLAVVAAGAWSFLALPAIVYPALPPGVESSLAIDTRQLSYLALVGTGVLGVVLGRLAWLRLAAVALAFALPAVVAVGLLPGEHVVTPVDDGLLMRFGVAAVGGQAVFWTLTGLAGLWLLEHRVGASLRRVWYRSVRPR